MPLRTRSLHCTLARSAHQRCIDQRRDRQPGEPGIRIHSLEQRRHAGERIRKRRVQKPRQVRKHAAGEGDHGCRIPTAAIGIFAALGEQFGDVEPRIAQEIVVDEHDAGDRSEQRGVATSQVKM